MNRYYMELLIRPDDREGPERPVKCNITAGSEIQARREALERAWSQGHLVSRFLSVATRSLA